MGGSACESSLTDLARHTELRPLMVGNTQGRCGPLKADGLRILALPFLASGKSGLLIPSQRVGIHPLGHALDFSVVQAGALNRRRGVRLKAPLGPSNDPIELGQDRLGSYVGLAEVLGAQ